MGLMNNLRHMREDTRALHVITYNTYLFAIHVCAYEIRNHLPTVGESQSRGWVQYGGNCPKGTHIDIRYS